LLLEAGSSKVPQLTHSWNHAQAFVGMVCALRAPQCGQARVDLVVIGIMGSASSRS
jgi:hypothetical protein